MKSFGSQLVFYRRESSDPEKGGRLTQRRLTELLEVYDSSLIYSKTQISNWENGRRKISFENRPLLVGIIYVFVSCGAIKKLEEANTFLKSGGYASLSSQEVEQLPDKKLFFVEPPSAEDEKKPPEDEKPKEDSTLLTISGILQALQDQTNNSNRLRSILAEIEGQRIDAITHLSRTQHRVLNVIPYAPTPIKELFTIIAENVDSLENVRTKEINLRLHELRYLGLIGRKRDGDHGWLYWRELRQSFLREF